MHNSKCTGSNTQGKIHKVICTKKLEESYYNPTGLLINERFYCVGEKRRFVMSTATSLIQSFIRCEEL